MVLVGTGVCLIAPKEWLNYFRRGLGIRRSGEVLKGGSLLFMDWIVGGKSRLFEGVAM